MKVLIRVSALLEDVQVHVTLGPGQELEPFKSPRLEFAPWLRPGPRGIPAPDDPDHEFLANGVPNLLASVVSRVSAMGKDELQERDLTLYGRLLFGAVLAPVWESIVERAAQAPAGELVELAFRVTPGQPPFQSVLWELLHDGTNFLVTHNHFDFAITRRIESGQTPDQIKAPARVLFAIGAELTDPEVRPGAEFLGLMRSLKGTGARLASDVVERASLARVAEAVGKFQPDVVHFIAHGMVDPADGVPKLLMRPDEELVGGRAVPATAEMLYNTVLGATHKPSIIVLAACESGALSAGLGTPIAQELVQRGAPVVLAMAGSVSDQACRLFTRRFATALAGGVPLLRAAVDARHAAYRRGAGPPSTTIDWALPSLFLAEGVAHEYVPVEVGVSNLAKRIESYGFDEGPVFCGRARYFELFDDVLSDGALNVLVIHSAGSTPGLGKTRLLREFGIRALLDGHVPCVVGLDDPEDQSPTSVRKFANKLLLAMVDARRRCGLPPPERGMELLRVLTGTGTELEGLPNGGQWRPWRMALTRLLSEHEDGATPTNEVLAAAITCDLADLMTDARAHEGVPVDQKSRAIVLLDNVDKWGDTVALLTPGILGRHGLGDEDEPVPVVMAVRAGSGVQDAQFQNFFEFTRGKVWIASEQLEGLERGNEEDLAYRWILLNANPIAPPVSEKTYTVINPEGQWRTWLGMYTEQIPQRFLDPKFYGYVKLLLAQQDLAEGDDDEALKVFLDSSS